MTILEFKEKLECTILRNDVISKINGCYGCEIPDTVAKIVSFTTEGLFFETDSIIKLLSLSEILEASSDLHVDFLEYKCIPLFDTGENDFIVYQFNQSKWAKMNIVDKTIFKQRDNLFELLK